MRREKGRIWTRYDKVQQAELTEVVSNLDGSLYAVLFNSGEYKNDSKDIRLAYHSLIDSGVGDNHIQVLEGDGNTENKFVDDSATVANLESAIDSVRRIAQPTDRLFLFITNHGNLVNGQSNFSTYDGKIWESDFEKMIQDLPINFGLFYFAQCHSGGFAERVGYGRNIGMSNVSKEEKAHGTKYGLFGIMKPRGACFSYYIFPQILKRKITIENAFERAVRKNTSKFRFLTEPLNYNITIETPQLRWQNADPSQLYLGSTSPSKK